MYIVKLIKWVLVHLKLTLRTYIASYIIIHPVLQAITAHVVTAIYTLANDQITINSTVESRTPYDFTIPTMDCVWFVLNIRICKHNHNMELIGENPHQREILYSGPCAEKRW